MSHQVVESEYQSTLDNEAKKRYCMYSEKQKKIPITDKSGYRVAILLKSVSIVESI